MASTSTASRAENPDIAENPFELPPEPITDSNPTTSTPRNNQRNPMDYVDIETNEHSSTTGDARRPFSSLKETKRYNTTVDNMDTDEPVTMLFLRVVKDVAPRVLRLLGKKPFPNTTESSIAWTAFTRKIYENLKKDQEEEGFEVKLSLNSLEIRSSNKEQQSFEERLHHYLSLSKEEQHKWPDSEVFYPYTISSIDTMAVQENIDEFRRMAIEGNRRWRSPGTLVPKIYPTSTNWKEATVMDIVNETFLVIASLPALAFDVVQGRDSHNSQIIRYFIDQENERKIIKHVTKAREFIQDPYFPLPKYGVSQRLLKQGMTRSEALAAAAIFRVEMEAVLLEIFHHSIPTLSESVFRTKRKEIPLMVMPFWENNSERTFQHEIPPHINANPRNRHQSQKARFSDAQHLHSNIASKNVGTNTNLKHTRKSHLGQGRLWESINGSHYFHNESNVPPVFELEEAEHSFHQRNEESIFVERLPGSENSQQDPDEEFNHWRPPFGDPDDPDDDDNDNGPPGGGPPNNPGNNGGGWHPRRPGGNHGFPGGGPPDGGPPGGGPPGRPFGGRPHNNPRNPRQQQDDGFKFEKKIKISEVPEWDGDTDKILEWLDDLNHLSFRGPRVHEELGMIAPLQLKGSAKAWFYALEPVTQRTIQRSWADFKLALSTYFMNQQWFDKMKGKILQMRYRQKGHESETPSDYYHRKLRMIQEVFIQTETETIMEIMNGAPKYWSVLIDTSRINTLAELQYYIKYHEDSLTRNPETVTYDLEKRIKALESRSSGRSSRTFEAEADANFVKKGKKFNKRKPIGAHAKFSDYHFPKNDKIISKGKTPGQKGARPCRHCGSLNHWDFDHPFTGKEDRKARTFIASLDTEALEAYLAYENCFAEESGSDNEQPNNLNTIEEEDNPQEISDDEDFPSSLV